MKILKENDKNITSITTITNTIRCLRRKRGLTQAQVAKALGISVYGYSKLESGKTILWLEKLFDICEVLNVEPVELFQACIHAKADKGTK